MITAFLALFVVGALGQPDPDVAPRPEEWSGDEVYGEPGPDARSGLGPDEASEDRWITPGPAGYDSTPYQEYYTDDEFYNYYSEYYEEHERAFGGLAHMRPSDLENIITEDGQSWSEEGEEMFRDLLQREICGLTADNCTSYNSFFLDCHCVEQLEMVQPRCKSFKCDLLNWLHDNGPSIISRLHQAENIRQMVDVVAETLPQALEQINFCECGKDTARALVNCARFYNGNVLKSGVHCDERDTIDMVQRVVDHKNTKKLLTGIVDGVCTEVKSGNKCYHNLIEALQNIASMVDNTIASFGDYEDAAGEDKRTLLKQCDNFFKPIDVFMKSRFQADIEYGMGDPDQEMVMNFFTAIGDASKSIYCAGNCRSVRSDILPCCFQRMVDDADMGKALGESILKYWNTAEFYMKFMGGDTSMDFSDWTNLNRMREGREGEEELPRLREMIPKELKDAFYRMLNPNKYSCKKPVKCFD